MAEGTGSPYCSPMAFLDTKRDRAAFLIFVLGIGLAWTLWPFVTGLIGAPVLYVVFAPVYHWLAARMKPGLAAGLVVLLGVIRMRSRDALRMFEVEIAGQICGPLTRRQRGPVSGVLEPQK